MEVVKNGNLIVHRGVWGKRYFSTLAHIWQLKTKACGRCLLCEVISTLMSNNFVKKASY